MKIRRLRRRFPSVPREAWLVAVIVGLGFVVLAQAISNFRLRAESSRFEAGQNGLLIERASLRQTARLWETEALEMRAKYGEPEASSTPSDVGYERPVAP